LYWPGANGVLQPEPSAMSTSLMRDKLRSEMLDATFAIIQREGLQSVQARRVTKEVGCSVGTLYNVFASLDDLLQQVNARTYDRLEAELAAALNGVGGRDGGRQAVLAFAIAYLGFATRNMKAWRALFEHRMRPERIAPWYRDRHQGLIISVEAALDGIEEPVVRRRTARGVFAAVHGVVALALDQTLDSFDPAEAERQVRLVIAAMVASLPPAAR
jgi:AcrR family transcriptional regulator